MPHASAFVPMLFEEMIAYTDGHSKLSLMAVSRSSCIDLFKLVDSFDYYDCHEEINCQ